MLPPPRAFVIPGLLYLLIGVACMALPQVAGLAIGLLLGVGLLAAGVLSLWFAGGLTGWPGAGMSFYSGLAAVAGGVLILIFPRIGLLTVTMLFAIFLLVDGLVKTSLGFQLSGMPGRGWILLHGIAALILAVLVVVEFPVAAEWVLGLFIGIHFMLKGWAWILLGVGRPPAA